eukprot:g473.t1
MSFVNIPKRGSRGFSSAAITHGFDIIAHRGASGFLPPHSIKAYEEAFRAGASWIEFDVCSTKDHQLVINHDITLDSSTNIKDIYSDRSRRFHAPCVDGEEADVEGWAICDFTLEEIKELSVNHSVDTRSATWQSNIRNSSVSPLGTTGLSEKENFRVQSVEQAAGKVNELVERSHATVKSKAARLMKRDLSVLAEGEEIQERENANNKIKVSRRKSFGNPPVKSEKPGLERTRTQSFDKKYLPFEGETERLVEKAYQDFQKVSSYRQNRNQARYFSFYSESNNQTYTLDFLSMSQMNVDTGHERRIRRKMETGEWYFSAMERMEVGLYIETKRPGWHRSIGLPLEEKMVEDLERAGWNGPVIIQSFEEDSLRRFKELKPEWKRVKLLTYEDIPMINESINDFEIDLDAMGTLFDHIADYANGIGPNKNSIVPNPLRPPKKSKVVDFAHARGLICHPYTFKTDLQFLHHAYGGNAMLEYALFMSLGVDGCFSDFPMHATFAHRVFHKFFSVNEDNEDRREALEQLLDTVGMVNDD